jgi:SAM-dependent methyltransferase
VSADDPYARIAAWYDAEFDAATADIAGYARRGIPGKLLVLGCGTGRVCRGLSGTREVLGLDRSSAMIARARARGGEFLFGDMEDFDVPGVAEIVIPNASFSFLPTRAAQSRCLHACARALAVGAPLTLDLPMPDFSRLGHRRSEELPAWKGVVDGVPVERTRSVMRAPVAQELVLTDRYYVGGAVSAESVLRLRLVFPAEVEWMLEAAGFAVDARWGDHAGGPVREGCDRLLVRALRV